MIQVEEMNDSEAVALLEELSYGHLGLSDGLVPYVVPIHYVFYEAVIYFYTTEGRKHEIIRENPNVCLQVEDVRANDDWKSVMVIGTATKLTNLQERERAARLITQVNPTLTPAISIRWMDDWVRENREVIYRIEPSSITGRYSIKLRTRAAYARPKVCSTNKPQ